jgi:PAS domain S-box-containing protein
MLRAELDTMTRLHGMASQFVRDGDLPTLLSGAVDAATAIFGADMAYLAVFAADTRQLKLSAHRGFLPAFLDAPVRLPLMHAVHDHHQGRGERIVVEDLGAAGHLLEGGISEPLAATGIRALQSTPLRGQSGEIVGLLSTYHRQPRPHQEHELRLLDLVARQCTDAIERARWIEACAVQNAQLQEETLRESKELFRKTVENMPANLILYDRDYRIVYLNPALARLTEKICGRRAEEILGLRGEEVWPPATWAPLYAHSEKAIATGERQTYDLAIDLPGLPRAVRQWTIVPLVDGDGQMRQILAMSHDVTAQRRLVDELREADERKSAFIAMLSHELRNPLAAIRTNLYLLEHGPPESEATARATRVIDRQIGHLVGMVDDLLDVTRITQDKIELRRQRLDLSAVVRETLEDNRSHLERGGVRFALVAPDRPLYVQADGARIAQVVTNLLTNAAKFTAAGGTARVVVRAGEDCTALISVADSGIGVDPTLLPQLFQPFMQGDRSLDRTGGGLGLGLALVKGLVELHGGSVSAVSGGRGAGAEFTVRLPLADAGALVPAESVVAQVAGEKKVLVIEDDLEIAEGLQAVLQIGKYQVEIARSGQAGIERARTFKPDAILCDIGLPGLDGYAVARAIRGDAALRSIFLVALSGYAQAEDVAKARAAGFDRHLAKPASIEKILRVLTVGSAARE